MPFHAVGFFTLGHDFVFKFIPGLKNFLEPAMFSHLAVLIYLCGRQDKRPKVLSSIARLRIVSLLSELARLIETWEYMQNKKDLRISLFHDAVAGRVNIRWTSYAITVRGLLVDITEWWPAYPYEFIMPIDNKILKTIAWGQPYSFSMCHNIYGVTCLWCTGTGLVTN